MGELVFGDRLSPEQQKDRLGVTEADSPTGKAAWFRLLCLATFLSVKLGRNSSPEKRISAFWNDPDKLGPLWSLWTSASPNEEDIQRETSRLFQSAIERSFNDVNASGEDAEMWRRSLYDLRKMHHLIYQNDFHTSLLELARTTTTRASDLVPFMKAGRLPGGNGDWRGVLAQSMTSPILFLIRELCRLEVIDQKRFQPAAYYMNSPARRVAASLGWIEYNPATVYGIQELYDMSAQVHRRVRRECPELEDYFDLPLQAFASKLPR